MTARQDILDHLETTLAALEEFGGRAYQIGQAGVDMSVQPSAVIGWSEDRIQYGPANGRFSRFLQVFVVLACQEGDDPLSETVDGLLAAVEAAVFADPTQGGHAYETANMAAELRPAIEGFPEAVAAVSFEVRYHVFSLGGA